MCDDVIVRTSTIFESLQVFCFAFIHSLPSFLLASVDDAECALIVGSLTLAFLSFACMLVVISVFWGGGFGLKKAYYIPSLSQSCLAVLLLIKALWFGNHPIYRNRSLVLLPRSLPRLVGLASSHLCSVSSS
jgi:hypothetical protein